MNPFKIHSFSSLNFKNGKSAVSGHKSPHSIFAIHKSLYNISNKIIYLICLRDIIIVMYYDKIINKGDIMKILANRTDDNQLDELIEEFYNTVDFKPVTEYAQNLLKLKRLDMKYRFENPKYYVSYIHVEVEVESNDFADINPILSAAFSQCYLVNFGGAISVENKKEYEQGADPIFKIWMPIHFWHHSHSGGENGDKLFEANYSQSTGEWTFTSAKR